MVLFRNNFSGLTDVKTNKVKWFVLEEESTDLLARNLDVLLLADSVDALLALERQKAEPYSPKATQERSVLGGMCKVMCRFLPQHFAPLENGQRPKQIIIKTCSFSAQQLLLTSHKLFSTS